MQPLSTNAAFHKKPTAGTNAVRVEHLDVTRYNEIFAEAPVAADKRIQSQISN